MKGLSATGLLRAPVLAHGKPLGRPLDLVLDLEGRRALGFEVACSDGTSRFLPVQAARIREREIGVASALMLLGGAEPSFYRKRGDGLRALLGAAVERGSEQLGALQDVLLGSDGAVLGLVVARGGEKHRIPFDGGVRIARRKGNASAA